MTEMPLCSQTSAKVLSHLGIVVQCFLFFCMTLFQLIYGYFNPDRDSNPLPNTREANVLTTT